MENVIHTVSNHPPALVCGSKTVPGPNLATKRKESSIFIVFPLSRKLTGSTVGPVPALNLDHKKLIFQTNLEKIVSFF
jgi:hypothetical protein